MDEYFSFHYDGEFATPLWILRRPLAEEIFAKKDWDKKPVLSMGDVIIEKISASYVVYNQGHFSQPIMVWDMDTKARLATIFEVTK